MGTRRAAAVIAVIAASMTLVTGCAEARSAPPSGVSAAELARYQDYMGSRMWELTGLPESMRPEVEATTVEADDWSELLDQCGDTGEVATAAGAQAAIITEYECRMSYQLSGESLGLLNEAQLDYLYDYYQDTLIPCLQVHGVEVRTVLTREEAVDIGRFGAYPWNPYGEASRFTRDDPGDATIWGQCPAFPPDAIFDRFWEP